MKKRLLFVALASFLMAGCAGEKEKCEVFLTPAPLSCVQTADRFASQLPCTSTETLA